MASGEEVASLVRAARGAGRTVTALLGVGFDPRALVGIGMLINNLPPDGLRVVTLGLPPAARGGRTALLADANTRAFTLEVEAAGLEVWNLAGQDVSDYRTAGIATLRLLQQSGHVPSDGVVIMDISSLPAAVYFPVIAGFLEAARTGSFSGELLVLACENPEIDGAIVEEGTSDPGPIHGFGHRFTDERRSSATLVWAPVLGEGQTAQLESIRQFLHPDEVCPVLPFPARNPRRADDLLLEHRVLLFEELEIEPRNIIYANESNPFDVYRALCRLNDRYTRHMSQLGDIVIATSVHASKLLSLGVLLAAYERKLTVVTSATTNYILREAFDAGALAPGNRLHCLWLIGEPYA